MNLTGILSVAAISLLSLYNFQAQADYTAQLYEQNSSRQKKLFDLKSTDDGKTGELELFTTTYTDVSGQPALTEKIQLRGTKVHKIQISQHQTKEEATVEVKDGQVLFTVTANGKTKTGSEKLKEPLVMSGNFVRYVHSEWSKLMEKGSVEFRYAVWYRLDTVGFKLIKEAEEGEGANKRVRLKMKPTSFIIAALVDPVIFYFSADGSKLLELNGRVAPKIKVGSDYKDLDAEAIYNHP